MFIITIHYPFDPETLGTLHFERPRYEDFPLLGMAYRSVAMGGSYTIAFNAANEVAVAAFLARSVPFPGIGEITAKVLERDWSGEPSDFKAVQEADDVARAYAEEAVITSYSIHYTKLYDG